MQLRHKVPLLVLFYPLVARGLDAGVDRHIKVAGLVLVIMVGSVELLFNAYRLVT
jgi:hypothetical protein